MLYRALSFVAFMLCVLCIAAIPYTTPLFAKELGAIPAMLIGFILALCAWTMVGVCVHFQTRES